MNLREVSRDVIRAANHYAIKEAARYSPSLSYIMEDKLRKAFIAGASYSKPIEHEQKPINGNGKESENNPDSFQERMEGC